MLLPSNYRNKIERGLCSAAILFARRLEPEVRSCANFLRPPKPLATQILITIGSSSCGSGRSSGACPTAVQFPRKISTSPILRQQFGRARRGPKYSDSASRKSIWAYCPKPLIGSFQEFLLTFAASSIPSEQFYTYISRVQIRLRRRYLS